MKTLSRLEIGLIVAFVLVFALALLLPSGRKSPDSGMTMEYEALFDPTEMHTLDIQVADGQWEAFLSTATDKEYIDCTVVIDGDVCRHVGLRAKGNSSMQRVTQARNGR